MHDDIEQVLAREKVLLPYSSPNNLLYSGRFRDSLCLDVAGDMQFFTGALTPVDPVAETSP
mgnify:CR=1 FL=1